MIRFENNVFLLSNDRLSYMMRVGEYGELQHIHFGGITYFEDASELSVKPGLGWGINSNFDETEPGHLCQLSIADEYFVY